MNSSSGCSARAARSEIADQQAEHGAGDDREQRAPRERYRGRAEGGDEMLAVEQGQRRRPPLRRRREIGRRTGLHAVARRAASRISGSNPRAGGRLPAQEIEVVRRSARFRLAIHQPASRNRPEAAGNKTATAPVSAAFRITPSDADRRPRRRTPVPGAWPAARAPPRSRGRLDCRPFRRRSPAPAPASGSAARRPGHRAAPPAA